MTTVFLCDNAGDRAINSTAQLDTHTIVTNTVLGAIALAVALFAAASMPSLAALAAGFCLLFAGCAAFERRLRVAALDANQEAYKATFDHANIGLLHMSLEGRYLMVNEAMAAILGLKNPEEMIGRTMENFTHPADAARDREYIKGLVAGDTTIPLTWEKRYMRKDGIVVPVKIATRIVRDKADHPLYFISVIQDLTEAHKIQDLLHLTINALPVSVGYMDLDFRYKFTNDVYREAFLTAHSDIQEGCLQAMFDADAVERLWGFRHAARDGVPGRTTAWMTQPGTGRRKLLDITYVPHRDDAGIVRGIIIMGEDITKYAESQQKILDQQNKLVSNAKLAALGEMAGSIAHEINNPLAIIDGKARQLRALLRNAPHDLEKIDGTIDAVTRMSERIARIVRGLRAFTRPGETDPFLTTPLAGVINDSLALCTARFKRQDVPLQIGDLPAGCELDCRATEISQVLINFLSNALDAVTGAEEPWVRLDAQDRGDTVEIAVTDSGSGIPVEIRDQIMRPFFTTKGAGKGTGLGLSISKGIVEGHRGELRLDETAATTRFVIVIPKRQPSPTLKEVSVV